MSFASKTRTQLLAHKTSRTAAANEYPQQFQKFASLALSKYDTYDNAYHWSNSQAKRFLTLMKNCPYMQSQVAYDLRTLYEKSATNYAQEKVVEASPATFATDNDPTYAEDALGKAQFNAFLFKEYDTWFPAFEAEAKDEGASIDTADYRWTFQTAKKLSKRVGLSMNYLEAVIGAWLLSHKKA
jgi:hypothetical protein